jgi:hypothetical protein
MASYPSEATYGVGPTTYSMSNRKPDRGYQITQQFNTSIFTSQIGYERRRQVSRRPKRQFSISYTNINGAYKQAIENFFSARGGDYESFEFDLAYIGQNGTIQVRFDNQLSVTEVQTTLALETNIYNVSFTLIESFT